MFGQNRRESSLCKYLGWQQIFGVKMSPRILSLFVTPDIITPDIVAPDIVTRIFGVTPDHVNYTLVLKFSIFKIFVKILSIFHKIREHVHKRRYLIIALLFTRSGSLCTSSRILWKIDNIWANILKIMNFKHYLK